MSLADRAADLTPGHRNGSPAPRRPGAHDDYVDFCEGVRRLCQIDLLQYKRGQMERRVRSFAERRGHPRLDAYLKLIGGDDTARGEFLDRMTINVSQLWRNPEQWELLERKIVPELAVGGSVTAWSAGCSYGAEAFTLAAVCRSAAPRARISITGTDIDQRVVVRARRGEFSDDDARSAPAMAIARYFDRDGDVWRAKPELRSLVTFEVGDLLRMRPRQGSFDLILCRNTVIYFNEDVRDELHARLAGALRPGGVLVVGATERVTDHRALGLEPAAPFTYRKA